MKDFAKRLRELRQEKEMTQKELADAVGISMSAIGMYEQGRREPSTEVIEELAKALGCSPAYLRGWSVRIPKEHVHSVPWTDEMDKDVMDIIMTAVDLNESSRDRLYQYARFLLSEEENKK